MKVTILLEVDVDDLDITSNIYKDSLTTEAWGVVQTDNWIEVEIESVKYQDEEVELTDSSYYDLQDYLSKQGESY